MPCKSSPPLSAPLQKTDTLFSYHGIATHYIHSTSLPALSDRLARLDFPDHTPLNEKYRLINSLLADFDTGLPAAAPQLSAPIRRIIPYCFGKDTPLAILEALKDVEEKTKLPEVCDWAKKTTATIRERSPIGVSVTLKALRLGKNWNIAQAFQNEYAIASVFMEHADFVTGVTARLIDRIKERPNWTPNTLEDVTNEDVNAFFKHVDSQDPLKLLVTGPNASYSQYSHIWLSLPQDHAILVEFNRLEGDKEAVLKHFLEKMGNKVGVKEKVEYVLKDQVFKDQKV